MSGDASRKRVRLEDEGADDNDDELRSVEDAEFWFDDGNIILEAGSQRHAVQDLQGSSGPTLAGLQGYGSPFRNPHPQKQSAMTHCTP